MIYDSLENVSLYFGDSSAVKQALAHARAFAPDHADGRYELTNGDYMVITSYETCPGDKSVFEAHRRHLDLQILLAGAERVDLAVAEKLEVAEPYSEKADAEIFKAPDQVSSIILRPGYFALL